MNRDSGTNRLFYGWYVAVGVGLTAFIAWGAGFYQLGLFVQAFHETHGWSLATLSVGTTIFYLIVGIGGLVTGRIVDRVGPRWVLACGSIILALGMLMFGHASSVWQVYLADAVVAAGFACTSTLVLGAVVGRWFQRRRAFVMTLALSGAPLGALLLVPASSLLLDQYGIAAASQVMAVVAVATILPLALFLIRDDPSEMGWNLDGDTKPAPAVHKADGRQWDLRSAAATSAWRLLTLSFALIMFCQVAYLVHQIAFLSPRIGAAQASVFVSITGAAGIAGRFSGGLGDRYPKHQMMALYCLVQGAGVLLAATSNQPVVLGLSAALVGFTMGNTVALQPVLMAERFGMRSYGKVFGPVSLLTQFGAAFGLTVVGVLADSPGGYTVAFGLTGSLALVAALAAYASGRAGLQPITSPSPAA